NIFDNIVESETLAAGEQEGLKLLQSPNSKFYGNIFRQNYMIQKSGSFKGYPLRTFVGNAFQGGYSDHFPVFIYIGK
ncbi:MAG: endonuclease/exonuclease/phosphatase family protein, partial [Alistipes sp.]|nr:endonuclease/exonuclease/phosphatase family protein [Alistipes sp.]